MRQRKPARRKPLFVEQLEDRAVPALVAEFAWSMEDRFADRGQYIAPGIILNLPDGRPDVFNDPAYIQATKFNVTFDAGPTRGAVGPVTHTWFVRQGGVLVTSKTAAKFTPALAEGTYQVTLRSQTATETSFSDQTVKVDDILIVSIGDSYSAGVGNPDVFLHDNDHKSPLWADGPNSALAQRSGKSAHALAAMALEKADPHTSVTYVSVAVGGAKIDDGMLFAKKQWNAEGPDGKVTEQWSFPLASQYGEANDAVRNTAFRAAIDPFGIVWEFPDRQPESQLSEMDRLLGSRDKEAMVLMTIGGNDIGFIPIVFKLLSGNEENQNLGVFDLEFKSGLDKLPDLYKKLGTAFTDIGIQKNQVFISEYPDMTRTEDGVFADNLLNDFLPFWKIDKTEVEWASTVETRLNSAIQAGALDNGWNFVTGMFEASKRHGINATPTEAWFNLPSTGRETSGPLTDFATAVAKGAAIAANPSSMALMTAVGGPLTAAIAFGVIFPAQLAAGVFTGSASRLLDMASTSGTAHPNDAGYTAWAKFYEAAIDAKLGLSVARSAEVAGLRFELVGTTVNGDTVRVRAVNAAGQTVAGYRGTVRITRVEDAVGGTPVTEIAAYTFTTADAGTHTFTLPLPVAGTQVVGGTVIQVFGLQGRGYQADSVTYTVEDTARPAFLASRQVDIPSETFLPLGLPNVFSSGGALPFVVRALTATGAPDTGYRGTVTFPGNGTGFVITPAAYTFTAADNGVKTFVVQFLPTPVPRPVVITVVDNGPLPRFRQQVVVVLPGPFIAAGSGEGEVPEATMFSSVTNEPTLNVKPFDPAFRGGVRVAVGDFSGDGVPDLVTAAGPGGGPRVCIFDGITGERIDSPLGNFFAYSDDFRGGVQVAVGDVDGDGVPDLVVAAGPGGGPHVRVFSGLTGDQMRSFYAFDPSFTGGVSVAIGDTDGDGKADIVTGAGAGGGPNVRVFAGGTGDLAQSYFAYAADFTGGVNVAVGDTDGDGVADVLTGAGPGGGSHVRVFEGKSGLVTHNLMADDLGLSDGVHVTAVDVDRDGRADIITGSGGGRPRIRSFDGQSLAPGNDLFAFDSNFLGGVNVGGRAKTT